MTSSVKSAAATLKFNSQKKDGDLILCRSHLPDILAYCCDELSFVARFMRNFPFLFTAYSTHHTVHVYTSILDLVSL
jgi:hypothetical protein